MAPGQQHRPSFISRWLAGGAASERHPSPTRQRPSFFGRLLDGHHHKTEDNKESPDREQLVERLTSEVMALEESDKEDKTFTLTANEVRLLLNLPLPKTKLATEEPEDSCPPPPPPPPPVQPLLEMNKVLDAWDFETNEELSGDEIQAIMIALAADQQEVSALTFTSSDSDNSDDESDFLTAPPPPSLSREKRQVTIQTLDESEEGVPQFLVTFAGNDLRKHEKTGSHDHPAVPPRPSLLCREFSIQPYPHPLLDDETSSTKGEQSKNNNGQETVPKPKRGSRRVSVQRLEAEEGDNDNDAPIQYVISLPQVVSDFDNHNNIEKIKIKDKKPSPVVRQVTVQPSTHEIRECNKDKPPRPTDGRPTLKGFRPMSVRLNGGRMFESFQVGPLDDGNDSHRCS